MTIIMEEYKSSTPSHIESARIALQCLLGRCQEAKIHAIKGKGKQNESLFHSLMISNSRLVNFSEMMITRINVIQSAVITTRSTREFQ